MALDQPVIAGSMERILRQAPEAELRLVGTASSVLRGIPLVAADIDILFRERSSIDAWVGALAPGAEMVTEPEWLSQDNQYFARLVLDGVTVELSTVEIDTDADVFECFGAGPWTHFDLVPCGHGAVRTVASELRLITELGRGREDRYRPIMDSLRHAGCDLDLVRRGLEILGASDAMIQKVHRQLSVQG